MGKQVAIHTHFNHSQEWSWVTREATQKLYEAGVIVRNQSVLLRGVNDTVEEMGNLIRTIADNNVQPVSVPPPPSPLSFLATSSRSPYLWAKDNADDDNKSTTSIHATWSPASRTSALRSPPL